ncbi:hypothetical protein FACS1894204_08250 [Synergistales bacterium]|nr:hypothetical protein FACS1894204_08250 [Synergistales bacterium]
MIELMVVMAIMAMTAVLVLPKGIFSFETTFHSVQRVFAELSEMALNGFNVRVRMDTTDSGLLDDRGRVVVEALTKTQDPFFPNKHTLSWQPVETRDRLDGEDWRLEPEIIYFYSDGTCTPARIVRADRDTRIEDGETTLLTVTGFLFQKKKTDDF